MSTVKCGWCAAPIGIGCNLRVGAWLRPGYRVTMVLNFRVAMVTDWLLLVTGASGPTESGLG